MKRTFFLSLTCSAVLIAMTSHVHASIQTIPSGLNPGDQYRLTFVTTGTHDAISADIGVYNNFVQSEANAASALLSLGATWNAIASTALVSARDNTGTNQHVDGVGVPIYLLNDAKIADDNVDFWDHNPTGSFIFVTPDGSSIDGFVHSGSRDGGIQRVGVELGTPIVGTGRINFSTQNWIEAQPLSFNFGLQPFYAMSSILTVPDQGGSVPEPTTLIVWSLLALTAGSCRRRSRGNH